MHFFFFHRYTDTLYLPRKQTETFGVQGPFYIRNFLSYFFCISPSPLHLTKSNLIAEERLNENIAFVELQS